MRFRAATSLLVTLLFCFYCPWLTAQTTTTNSTVPKLIRFSGKVNDATGRPLGGTVGLTFSLYTDEQGGASLWLETQNVQLDANGHYTVSLGATKSEGLPLDLFASGEARWLGVQPQGQPEQPRVLLLAVPYALKAADAETVGGLPPSAFVRTDLQNGAPASGSSSQLVSGTSLNGAPPPINKTVTTPGGTANFIPLWTGATTIGSSLLFQSGNNIGIGTTTPNATFDVRPFGNSGDAVKIGNPAGCSGTSIAEVSFAPPAADCGNYSLAGDGTSTYINRPVGGSIQFREGNNNTGGGSQLLIAPGGNVGIGTTTPATKLDLFSGAITRLRTTTPTYSSTYVPTFQTLLGDPGLVLQVDAATGQTSTDSFQGIYFNAFNAGTTASRAIIAARSGGNWGELSFHTQYGGDGKVYERMRMDASGNLLIGTSGQGGNVGIGTAAPAFHLDVLDDVNSLSAIHVKNASSGTNALTQARLENDIGSLAYEGVTSSTFNAFPPINGGKAFWISYLTDAVYGNQAPNNNIIFTQNTKEVARFNTLGLLGIGTTSPSAKLDVVGSLKLEGSGNGIIFPDGSVQTSAAGNGGGGTITGVVAGTDLTGGGTQGTVTLNLNVSATDARYVQKGSTPTLTGVFKIYTSSTDLSCPSGYVVVVASCNAAGGYFVGSTFVQGGTLVLNDQSSPLPPGATSWAHYLTPNASAATGVHCNLGSSVSSEAELRCVHQ